MIRWIRGYFLRCKMFKLFTRTVGEWDPNIRRTIIRKNLPKNKDYLLDDRFDPDGDMWVRRYYAAEERDDPMYEDLAWIAQRTELSRECVPAISIINADISKEHIFQSPGDKAMELL